ncbi:MAG: DHH family phosphoesterase [Mycoplasmoidaceae bacterium]
MKFELSDVQKVILNKISKYDKISLFFHERPDFDALGSCYALKQFINDNFDGKDIKVIGLDTLDNDYLGGVFEPELEPISQSFLNESLGIVSDTSNSNRVYSGKHKFCKELIRVDHHPEVEIFATTEWVDPTYPAACQMWAEIFFASNLILSATTASYLYAGIITDTGRFLHYNTLPSTYFVTSKLIDTGFNRAIIHNAVYTKDKRELMFSSYVIRKTKIEDMVAYAIIPKGAHEKFGIKVQYSMVHVLNDIKDVMIWSTLYYDENEKGWKGSIRSNNIPINHIAERFNGGGHKFAAGFSLNSKQEYYLVIDELKKYVKEIIN